MERVRQDNVRYSVFSIAGCVFYWFRTDPYYICAVGWFSGLVGIYGLGGSKKVWEVRCYK